MNILVVEDEPKVGKALSEGLKANGYEVTLAQTGEDGFFIANSHSFDLIVLDVMLPGRNGIEVLKTLRRQGLQVPVLLLTAKDAVEDRVLGLDAWDSARQRHRCSCRSFAPQGGRSVSPPSWSARYAW
jgi:two-component system copper resistance phosphate regulon response regulator CusR